MDDLSKVKKTIKSNLLKENDLVSLIVLNDLLLKYINNNTLYNIMLRLNLLDNIKLLQQDLDSIISYNRGNRSARRSSMMFKGSIYHHNIMLRLNLLDNIKLLQQDLDEQV